MGVGVVAVLTFAIVFYRVLVPRRPRPSEVTSTRVSRPLVTPAYAATNGTNGASGVTSSGQPARGAVRSTAPAPTLAGNPPRGPRRRVERDFMNGDGVIVGRDYM